MTTSIPAAVRRALVLAVSGITLLGLSVTLAGPAAADVPEGWPVADDVDELMVLAVFVGLPLLLALITAAAVYLPAVARGERVAPGTSPVSDQWLGGPRRSAGELAAPDSPESKAGGASGRW